MITLHRIYLRITYLLHRFFWWCVNPFLRIWYWLRPQDRLGSYLPVLITLIRRYNYQKCHYCYNRNHVTDPLLEWKYCPICGGDVKYELGDRFLSAKEHHLAQLAAFDIVGVQPMLFNVGENDETTTRHSL